MQIAHVATKQSSVSNRYQSQLKRTTRKEVTEKNAMQGSATKLLIIGVVLVVVVLVL